jgi:hypothetical protein
MREQRKQGRDFIGSVAVERKAFPRTVKRADLEDHQARAAMIRNRRQIDPHPFEGTSSAKMQRRALHVNMGGDGVRGAK